MATRADFLTETGIRPERYSDFLINFDRNPITGALAVARDDVAVKLALKNLALTIAGERPYRKNIGSHLYDRIGDMADDGVARNAMLDQLQAMVATCEPRAVVMGVRITGDRTDQNSMAVTIVFGMRNTGLTETLTVPLLKRTR